jgi:hypothetical protein
VDDEACPSGDRPLGPARSSTGHPRELRCRPTLCVLVRTWLTAACSDAPWLSITGSWMPDPTMLATTTPGESAG